MRSAGEGTLAVSISSAIVGCTLPNGLAKWADWQVHAVSDRSGDILDTTSATSTQLWSILVLRKDVPVLLTIDCASTEYPQNREIGNRKQEVLVQVSGLNGVFVTDEASMKMFNCLE